MVCLSTDKAAYPINAMGTSKAMMEKIIVAKARTVDPEKTRICCTRYGEKMYETLLTSRLVVDELEQWKRG